MTADTTAHQTAIHEDADLLRFATAGSVDDGNSYLMCVVLV